MKMVLKRLLYEEVHSGIPELPESMQPKHFHGPEILKAWIDGGYIMMSEGRIIQPPARLLRKYH